MAETIGISTYGIELHCGATAEETKKLVDIKTFPDLGGDPEMLDATTLSHAQEVFVKGIQSGEALEFEYNYTKANYTAVKAEANKPGNHYKVVIGTGAELQEFAFQGEHTTKVSGGGVNEVVGATITIAPSTEITAVE